jgi:hypothetical protein
MTSEAVWACERSVDADVPASFAWAFMTDVRNWSDPPAEFTLEGPFAAGTRGTTRMPEQPTRSWMIQDVTAGRAYAIHGSLAEDAFVLFRWQFDALSEHRTRLTQRLELCGENAAAYVNDIQSAFEPNLEAGMRRIAEMMMTHAAQDP